MRHTVRIALVVVAALTSPLAAAPQPIEVRVVDSEARPLPDISVEIASVDGEPFVAERTSNQLGLADFELPSAERKYRLTVDRPEFAPFEQSFDLSTQRVGRGETVRLKITLTPPDALDHFNRGVRALQTGDFAAAEPELRRAVEVDPAFGRGWTVLAMTTLELGRAEDALAAAERSLALAPTEVEALRVRFESLSKLGRAEEAEIALDTLAEHDASPALAPILFNAGALAANADEPERARRRLAQALERNPQLWQAHAAIAELEIRAQQLEGALAKIDEAIALAPAESRLWRRKIELLRALGRDDEASETERRLAELSPES